MPNTATRPSECSPNRPTLYVGLDLSKASWQLAFSAGWGGKRRQRAIPGGDLRRFAEEVYQAKVRLGLPRDARVVSCYEAGRDGFGPHRAFLAMGIESLVVDPASIEVPRHARRVKTDRIDAVALVGLLIAYDLGERKKLRVVGVPSVEEEDQRQLHRELATAQRDAHRVRNRIVSLLAAQGIAARASGVWSEARLAAVRRPDGGPLPGDLHARLVRDAALLEDCDARVRALEQERHRRLHAAADADPALARVRQLMQLRGIGETGAWVLVMEYFWRRFANRRQVAAGAGLTPTPFRSGTIEREQGISKRGNARVRCLMVELAWAWLRYQPHSGLARWYHTRFAGGPGRMRRIGIVALARKLLIGLWRYLRDGELPEGAALKSRAAA